MEPLRTRKNARLKNPGNGWLAYSIIACGVVLLLGIWYFLAISWRFPFTGAVTLLAFAGCAAIYLRETSRTKAMRTAIANSMILVPAVYVLALGIVMGTAVQIEALILGEDVSGGPLTQSDLLASMAINFITMFFSVVAFSLIRRKGVSSFGLSTRNLGLNMLVGTIAGIMLFMFLVAVVLVLSILGVDLPQSEAGSGFSTIGIPLSIAVSLTAAITEETFFRGFLQTRIGLIAASVLFGFAHIGYGTVTQIVFPFLYALVFGWLYKRTGTLAAPMAAHFAYDMIVLGLAQI